MSQLAMFEFVSAEEIEAPAVVTPEPAQKAATPRQTGRKHNHPKKGSNITVEPIRNPKDIKLIKMLLADRPRDLALFVTGINSNLRASDLLRITVGQVRYLKAGESFQIKEQKTQKSRMVTINGPVLETIRKLLATMPAAKDGDLLFQSRKKSARLEVVKETRRSGTVTRQPLQGEITVQHLNQLVKSWCREAKIKGSFGSHSLRKTFGFQQRTLYNVPVYLLMQAFNHSSERQTLTYLGIQAEEVRDVFLNAV